MLAKYIVVKPAGIEPDFPVARSAAVATRTFSQSSI